MKKQDFLFTIGYHGNVAMVDAAAARKYGKLSTRELLQEGLFKAAFCSALYNGAEEEVLEVLEVYNRKTQKAYEGEENLKRLFGVFDVPHGNLKLSYI